MTNEPYLVTTRRHMSAVIELHALSFNLAEQTKLTHALLDKSHFSLLIGDKEPVGYMVFVIQGKEATGLWAGVKPEHRGEGLYRKMQLAGLNECRVRGAETYNGYVSLDNDWGAHVMRLQKNLGMTVVKTYTDTYINDDGERVEFTCNHVQLPLLPIANRNDYDKKIFTCDGEGTHSKVYFQYTPKISNVRPLVDGKLTAVCPQCDRDVIYNG